MNDDDLLSFVDIYTQSNFVAIHKHLHMTTIQPCDIL